MAASTRSAQPPQLRSIVPRTDKSPGAPCHLREHWAFPHTNRVCSKQQRPPSTLQTVQSKSLTQSQSLSDSGKIRRFNQLAAAGVLGYNAQVSSPDTSTSSAPPHPSESNDSSSTSNPSCQFATSYNTVVDEASGQVSVTLPPNYPPPSSTNKPTLADTACNQHIFGSAMLLDNIRTVDPVWINVENTDKSSRILATQMGTAHLHSFDTRGTPTMTDVPNVLYSPSLPANLISITQPYDSGYRSVDPHFGSNDDDLNLYFGDHNTIIPAYKDSGPGGFWRFYHYSEPRALSTVSSGNLDTDIWHLRFGHLNSRNIEDVMEDVLRLNPTPSTTCEACTLGKQARSIHCGSLPCSEIPAYRIHCDLASPFPDPSVGGFLYTMVLIDDAS